MPGQNLPSKTRRKPNAREKLTPEIPNAWARTFVPIFVKESPPPSFISQLYMFHQRNTQF